MIFEMVEGVSPFDKIAMFIRDIVIANLVIYL